VNCINPGTIVIPEEPAQDSSEIDVSKIPMKRYGTVEDIFELAYFFATCSNFITGQIVNVDGGFHLCS
jgi:3-oxoacyl-[acyl-carrier protein] reductase